MEHKGQGIEGKRGELRRVLTEILEIYRNHI